MEDIKFSFYTEPDSTQEVRKSHKLVAVRRSRYIKYIATLIHPEPVRSRYIRYIATLPLASRAC